VQVNPLHLAAEMGHETTAVLLIFHGAEIDLRVRDRGTGRCVAGSSDYHTQDYGVTVEVLAQGRGHAR